MKNADYQVVEKILNAQNALFDLPTEETIARFYAKSLVSLPGVSACRMCLRNASSQKGEIHKDLCQACEYSRHSSKESALVPKSMQCRLDALPGSYILPIETPEHRFGCCLFLLKQKDLFERYAPFIQTLLKCVALSLENRLQKRFLQQGNAAAPGEHEKHSTQVSSSHTPGQEEQMASLHFWESMASTSRAIHDAHDLEEMMTDVLDVTLSIFDSDRAWLVYPCDPDAASWSVPMERTKAEYPGAHVLGLEVPMDPDVSETHKIMLASDGPVTFGPGTAYPLPENIAQQFGFQSLVVIVLYPKVGKPWLFGMHQCSYARQWTTQEERLFQEIGRRLEDALTSLLSYRKLQESEERYRLVFENSPVSLWEEDFSAVKVFLDSVKAEGVEDIEQYVIQHPEVVQRCADMVTTLDVNSAALTLHRAATKDELLAGLVNILTPESFEIFREFLVGLWKGAHEMKRDTIVKTLDGELRNVTLSVSVCPGYEETLSRVIVSLVDITERKFIEQERMDHLHFLENMDSINRAIQGENDLEQMMSDVLDEMLSIFDCDRAWLLYPCDPDAASWSVPMERTKPEYIGAHVLGVEVPMDAGMGNTLKAALASDGPANFGPGADYPFPEKIARQFAIKSFLIMALYPKVGKPWLFGMHQCSYVRQWTTQEEKLLQEIGNRLEDGLTSLLSYRNLQQSEEQYRLVFENSPVSVWEEDFSGVKALLDDLKKAGVVDIETYFEQHPDVVRECASLVKIVDINRATLILHEAGKKEDMLAGLVNTFSSESFKTFREELVCIWNEETEMTRDTVVKTLTGAPRNVSVYFSVCPGYEHTLSKVLVSLVDISARKRAEAEVRALKDHLANIIDSMPSVLVGIDRHEIVTQWNRQAEDLTGISAAAAIGRPLSQALPDFFVWIATLRRDIEQQRHVVMEHRILEKEGESRFYDLMLYPLIANSMKGAVIRIEDVTEQTHLRELMIQSEKMTSIGGLAAGMAHEINNPLSIILQAVQNVQRRVAPEFQANRQAADALDLSLERMQAYLAQRQIPEFLDSIQTAASRAAKIVANMLRFSRRAETARQPASLSEILEQALELATADYDLKKSFDFLNIEIVRDYTAEMPVIQVVMVEIEQVLLNLLKNAAQAMNGHSTNHQSCITLRLRCEARYAVIEVEDNGPGMDEATRRRVFEPFFTTKAPGIGTGLGLSVSYMIITQNHKGLIEVTSSPGKGTCFRIRLPLMNQA